jgi:hypothetical protein
MDWGTVPQWITAFVAVGALIAACVSIGSQRAIARKRAAIDFFIKTEMDRETLSLYDRFAKAVGVLEEHQQSNLNLETFVNTESYWDIRGFLNLNELMGVGINKAVLDEDVCYDFWSGELRRAYEKTKVLIEHIQGMPRERFTYIELVAVSQKWTNRDKKQGRG